MEAAKQTSSTNINELDAENQHNIDNVFKDHEVMSCPVSVIAENSLLSMFTLRLSLGLKIEQNTATFRYTTA